MLQKDSSGSFSGYIQLNEYKTAKTYGDRRVPLHPPFIRTLLNSLRLEPRTWLFVKQANKSVAENTPYDSANSFGQYASKTLKRLFGKPLTLVGARHSFITHLHCCKAWAGMSDLQREELAKQMGHSYTTACRYRFVARSSFMIGLACQHMCKAFCCCWPGIPYHVFLSPHRVSLWMRSSRQVSWYVTNCTATGTTLGLDLSASVSNTELPSDN